MEHLNEIGCGTYQTEQAPAYTTNIVNMAANGVPQQNQTLQNFNHLRAQPPAHVRCFYWDQQAPPGNWPAGQQWQPVRILVSKVFTEQDWSKIYFLKVTPNIPSRYTGTKRHTTVIAYVPVAVAGQPAWPLNPPPPGQSYTTSREVRAIKMWCCGPRHNNTCIPGARTTV